MLYRAYRVWWLVALIRAAFGVRRLSRINTYMYIEIYVYIDRQIYIYRGYTPPPYVS